VKRLPGLQTSYSQSDPSEDTADIYVARYLDIFHITAQGCRASGPVQPWFRFSAPALTTGELCECVPGHCIKDYSKHMQQCVLIVLLISETPTAI